MVREHEGEGVRIKYEEAMKYGEEGHRRGWPGAGRLPVGWENREQELTVREPEGAAPSTLATNQR